ncbi:MAG: DUF3052 family protein [Pyrinomonadaceae bacterium]
MSAGYSGTPLIKKLGIKEGSRVAFVNPPGDFRQTLGPIPAKAKIVSQTQKGLDLVLLFVKRETELVKSFATLAAKLQPAGMLWVAWPKKSSGVATDLTFTNVQSIGLAAGLVDTKICAVDETWSGLKFVFRLKDRPRLLQGKKK